MTSLIKAHKFPKGQEMQDRYQLLRRKLADKTGRVVHASEEGQAGVAPGS